LLSLSLLTTSSPSFFIGSQASPDPTLFPIGPPKFSALADWFLYLEPIPIGTISQSDHNTPGFKPQRAIQPKSFSQRSRCLIVQPPTSSNNP
jgi:hypothetical protein